MSKTLTLEITSPHGAVFSGEVSHVRAPGVNGSFGVLPGHTEFLSPLEVGLIDVTIEGKLVQFTTSGGLAEVHSDKVEILAETAEKVESIDVERAKAAAERARKRLEAHETELDVDRARAALARALNRLHATGVNF